MKKENETKDIGRWSKKEFEALPVREWNEDIGEFDSLIILPTNYLHDSGFKCMDFVAVVDNIPKCRLSGCSDVMHLNGIGGFGDNWLEKYGSVPSSIKPISWNIDCLKRSKLLRLFCNHNKLKAGEALSSFEIYAVDTRRKI